MADEHDNRRTDKVPLVKGGQGRTDAEIEQALLGWILLFIILATSFSIWLGTKIADLFF